MWNNLVPPLHIHSDTIHVRFSYNPDVWLDLAIAQSKVSSKIYKI